MLAREAAQSSLGLVARCRPARRKACAVIPEWVLTNVC